MPFCGTLLWLCLAHGSLAIGDVAYTEHNRARRGYSFKEYNPIARPIVGHPALTYSLAASEVTATAWLGNKMRNSRFHRVWWLPQAIGIAGHAYALSRSVARNRH